MSLHAVAQTDAFNCRIATAVHASEAWKALRPARLYDAQADELFELMQEGYLRRIDRLLRHGARAPGVNMRNRVGMSVLHAVCFYRRDMVVADGGDSGVVDLVPHFVERGADVNAATIGGITPLMMLVYERSHLAEMFDLEQGAVVKKKMLEALLAAGADPNLRAGIGPKADIFCNGALSGKTALEIARAGKYPAVAAFIEAKMAEPVS
ncbi:hypothetical protein EMIHUDRAFT_368959 [Emiliania huxleyi CCMP1516]|uniref:Ankyrin repeat domain-containing protein n=2 Tax=Emiliania huxleyi TaxID=2903 RepID=A0A0D3JBK3_EMIH1|nr:hypothetical protein EMIHUDRAFT_368959 [Emiliania huxleyi CCMP1516]EOD20888.1 hypothetical protein EMIHUDRAFT_368959 [Emiliania huxleyi CCMP1516]|eukprot:XP_005773317.1 hypothetical protein EMIHUDRAFT_368959 [Emiliania huxleyi CCMP1516]